MYVMDDGRYVIFTAQNVDDPAELMRDRMWQKAIVMSLINIGELSKSFTEDYLAAMPGIPWKAIRGFRNIAAHQYGIIDFEDVYKTILEDIPRLKQTLLDREA